MKVLGVFITLCTILILSQAVLLNSTLATGRCEYRRQNCSNSPRAFCPQCDSNGNFLPQQCSESTGSCWCVNITSGNEIPNTRNPLGTAPDCGHALGNGARIESPPTPPTGPGPVCANCSNAAGSGDDENLPKEPGLVCDDCGNAAGSGEEETLPKEPGIVCVDCAFREAPRTSYSNTNSDVHECPNGWSRFGERCFIFVNTPKTWIEAEVYCQFDGANLASVHCDKGNRFIMSLTRGDTRNFPQAWLGGFDAIHPGYWMWSDGSEFDYKNWYEKDRDEDDHKNHDDHDKKNCLRMNYEYDLKWFYASCTDSLPFVCAKSVVTPPDRQI